jgi:hypothetical protein
LIVKRAPAFTNLLRFRAITGNNYVIQAEYRQAASIAKSKLHLLDQVAKAVAAPSLVNDRKSDHVKKFSIHKHISKTTSGGGA